MGDSLSLPLLAAGTLMGLGVWLHLTELHSHEHTHEIIEHEHDEPPAAGVAHSHRHPHERLTHHHAHFPYAHHRHGYSAMTSTLTILTTVLLFIGTALAEIIGCYLPYLWLRKDGSPWLLLPAAMSLTAFVWLLSLHPVASGRVYAAYGGVYVIMALMWLRLIDGIKLNPFDWLGAGITLLGMTIMVLGWRS